MLQKPLASVQTALLRHPRAVLAGSLAVTLLAAWLGWQVELRTSRQELAPAGDPNQARWERLLDDYDAAEAVVACVRVAGDGTHASPEGLTGFSDALAEALEREPAVARVFHRLDVDWFVRHALHLAPVESLERVGQVLRDHRELLVALATAPDLPALNRVVAGAIEGGRREATAQTHDAQTFVEGLAALVEWQRAFLEAPDAALEGWSDRSALELLVDSRVGDGYPGTYDRSVLFLLISPRDPDDALDVRRRLMAGLRRVAAGVQRDHPGFEVAFTGTVAMTVEEMDAVRGDTWRSSLIAVVGVGLLTLGVFRRRTHALLVLGALAIGVIWAIGAVWLELGYLNMITSSFISTLIGVGVAYGIHPVSEYELLSGPGVEPVAAVREAYARTGSAVVAAALTTSVAFFSILLMRFPGFSEMGFVAGFGVLLCLASALITLPAMLVLHGNHRRTRAARVRSETPIDRFWLERVSAHVCGAPRTTCIVALVLTVAAGLAAADRRFDTNLLNLLPEHSEAARYQRVMAFDSDFSPVFNFVVASDLSELARMESLAAREPAIGRFESALPLIPSDRPAAAEHARRWSELLDVLPGTTAWPAAVERSRWLDAIRELEAALADAADDAFAAGSPLAGVLERARSAAEDCATIVTAATPARLASWGAGQRRLAAWRQRTLDGLRQAVRAPVPGPEDLPVGLADRFFTRDGRPVGFLFPAGQVFDPDELAAYVAASRRVAPDAIGFPVMLHETSARITSGFRRAVGAGALLVWLILLIDLRSLRDSVLAMTPLALGLVWTLGISRGLGLSLNFANLVAVPLIIGVGIDNGVHVIHRARRESSAGMDRVLRHTGRAILIASLTTMIGFGSLAAADHRGLASLGLLLLIGVAACLVTSTVVLPNLLVLIGTVRRR